MLIFDGDYPMAVGAIDMKRDLTRPLSEVRAAELTADNVAIASLPEMRRGKVAVALVKIAARIERPGNPLWGYRTGDVAYAMAHAQLAYYRLLASRAEARIISTAEALRQHMAAWSASTSHDALPVGFVVGMEGADPILWPEQVHEWYAAGVRVVSLTHYGVSTYAHGTSTHGGLLPSSRPLLREMERCGMLLDLTHIDDESFWQALESFSGPVLASHQNCRALVPGGRQFSDEQLKALIERGAVIGVSLDTWMLYPHGNLDWDAHPYPTRRSRFAREAATLEQVADNIDHICQLAGSIKHAAIGGDTDGQGGRDGMPFEIDTVADYQKIGAVLAKRGYAAADIAGIMHGNWQRFYEKWLR